METIINVLFIALVIFLFIALLSGLNSGLKRKGTETKKRKTIILITTLSLFVWIAFLSFLAVKDFFLNFTAIPPRLVIVVLPPIVFLIILCNSKKFSEILKYIPGQWMTHIQSFRIIMEIILWMLFLENIAPIQMTFEGRNFDILVGITAPIIGFLCFRKNQINKRLALMWNVFSLLVLLNIVVVAVLSTPVPFRYFMNEPANTFIARFPFVLLPGFVVPVAYYMHVLSIKKLLKEKTN